MIVIAVLVYLAVGVIVVRIVCPDEADAAVLVMLLWLLWPLAVLLALGVRLSDMWTAIGRLILWRPRRPLSAPVEEAPRGQ